MPSKPTMIPRTFQQSSVPYVFPTADETMHADDALFPGDLCFLLCILICAYLEISPLLFYLLVPLRVDSVAQVIDGKSISVV